MKRFFKMAVVAAAFVMAFAANIQVFAAEEYPVDANKIVAFVNAERTAKGLSALKISNRISKDAVVRAEEASTFFSHNRPDGTPFYTVDEQVVMAENLATGQFENSEQVVDDWMASPAHKANVLYPAATTIGVAVYQTANGDYYISMLTD